MKLDHSIKINAESLKKLIVNYDLYELQLDARKMDVEQIFILNQSTSLQSLHLNNGRFNWEESQLLAQNTTLRHLHLDGSKFMDKDVSQQLFSKLTNLLTLSLKDTDLEDDNVQELLKLPNLIFLDVTNNADVMYERSIDELYESYEAYGFQSKASYGPALSLRLCQKLEKSIKSVKHDFNTKKPSDNRQRFEDLHFNFDHD
ncbi:MAG: hypothetical protein ACRYGR_04570 [Janthinobacterium lividum]